MALIQLVDVSYTYPNAEKPALSSLSLSLNQGEYLAVVGPNGSGKSSLLRLLAGLATPTSGKLFFASQPNTPLPNTRPVILVIQNPADQIVSSSVFEDVAFGPELLGLSREEIQRRVDDALTKVGLFNAYYADSRFLSAGQQQRLAIASALASASPCIVFDEATAMLDPEARIQVMDLMDSLHASGRTIVHVTHDMEEAQRADRVLALFAGKPVFDGTPAALFSAAGADMAPPQVLCHILGLPAAVALARELGLPPRLKESAADLGCRISETLASGSLSFPISLSEPPPKAKTLSADPAFVVEGAGHVYLRGTARATRALNPSDFIIQKGEVVAFVGRTGSGKSTAMQLLDGILSASEGRVTAFGQDVSSPKLDIRQLRMRVPLAVQRPESALFERYAADDVAFGPRNLGLRGKALVDRVRASMEKFGLPYSVYRDRICRSLSGGEKRRLALAGVFAMEGEAVLLDEPGSALDPETRSGVMRSILSLQEENRAVVFITHSMEEAAAADRIAVFFQGSLAAFDTPRRIFYELFDPSWGIERPFAVKLCLALQATGIELAGFPLTQEELIAALSAYQPGLDTADTGKANNEGGQP